MKVGGSLDITPATLPGSPTVGALRFDLADNILKWWSGSKWEVAKTEKPLARVLVVGHSHPADGGATASGYGASHKVSVLHGPRLRTAAIGGAIGSWSNAATVGDGGWPTVFDQCRRDEQSKGLGNTTVSVTYTANANSISVAERAGLTAGQFIVVGVGASVETMQVSTGYTPTTGSGAVSLNARLSDGLFSTSGHAVGDPVWNDPITYQAKDQNVIIGFGANDVPAIGPYPIAPGSAGQAPGFGPLVHAMRAMLSRTRLAVFYDALHVSSVAAGTWGTSFVAGAGLVSFTQVTTGGQTRTHYTPPSFKGGTVAFFFLCSKDGDGGTVDVQVNGGTTISNAINANNVNAFNKSNTRGSPGLSGKHTIVCYRVTGLAAGVNTILLTCHPAQGSGSGIIVTYFMGWGIEAPIPPSTVVVIDPRTLDYALWGFWPYCTRQANTYASGGTGGSVTVTLQSAYVIAGTTEVAGSTKYAPGDTITIGNVGSGNRETRVIVGTPSTTTVTIDSTLSNSHTAAETVVVGLQDADITGGMSGQAVGPANHSCYLDIKSLVDTEFDQYVVTKAIDTVLNKSATNFIWDRAHYNDYGHANVEPELYVGLQSRSPSETEVASSTVPDKRTWLPVQGMGLAIPTFLNSCTQYAQQTALSAGFVAGTTAIPVADRTGFNPTDVITIDDGYLTEDVTIVSSYVPATGAGNLTTNATASPHPIYCIVRHADPPFGYSPEFPTGLVYVQGAMKGVSSGVAMYQMPSGLRPRYTVPVYAIGASGDAAVVVDPQGFISGGPDSDARYTTFFGSYPMEF